MGYVICGLCQQGAPDNAVKTLDTNTPDWYTPVTYPWKVLPCKYPRFTRFITSLAVKLATSSEEEGERRKEEAEKRKRKSQPSSNNGKKTVNHPSRKRTETGQNATSKSC